MPNKRQKKRRQSSWSGKISVKAGCQRSRRQKWCSFSKKAENCLSMLYVSCKRKSSLFRKVEVFIRKIAFFAFIQCEDVQRTRYFKLIYEISFWEINGTDQKEENALKRKKKSQTEWNETFWYEIYHDTIEFLFFGNGMHLI